MPTRNALFGIDANDVHPSHEAPSFCVVFVCTLRHTASVPRTQNSDDTGPLHAHSLFCRKRARHGAPTNARGVVSVLSRAATASATLLACPNTIRRSASGVQWTVSASARCANRNDAGASATSRHASVMARDLVMDAQGMAATDAPGTHCKTSVSSAVPKARDMGSRVSPCTTSEKCKRNNRSILSHHIVSRVQNRTHGAHFNCHVASTRGDSL